MRNFGFNLLMVLFFLTCFVITSEAQDLLPTTESQPEKIRAHQVKLDYLKLLKFDIEDKQRRKGQNEDPSDEDTPFTSPDPNVKKLKSKNKSKKKSKKVNRPD